VKPGDKVLINIPNVYKNVRGVYVGLSRHGFLLRVKRDGIKTVERYHPNFITPGDGGEGK
jgi:hypothetical protein